MKKFCVMQNIINPNLQKKFGMPISCFFKSWYKGIRFLGQSRSLFNP